MATLAGAFGLGTIVGPLVATLFVLPGVGLAGPMFAFAIIAAIMLGVVWVWLVEEKAPPAPLSDAEQRFGLAFDHAPLRRSPRLRYRRPR